MAPLFYPAELSNIRHTRSKVGWKNEHTAGYDCRQGAKRKLSPSYGEVLQGWQRLHRQMNNPQANSQRVYIFAACFLSCIPNPEN